MTPREHDLDSPAADPAGQVVGAPAAAGTPDLVAAGINDRRQSLRLCGGHFARLEASLSSSGFGGPSPLVALAQDAVVGCAAYLAGERASEMVANGCPLCFLVEHSSNPWAGVEVYERLIDIAVRHVLESAR
jgi:hypothetical protein